MEAKRWTSGIESPAPWMVVCKCCGAVVRKVRLDSGPGFYCIECQGFTVA